jgi:multimeric flavodoxin WrbA
MVAMKALIINCSPVREGATAEIVRILDQELLSRYETKCICIDDYDFEFCKGCRSCHKTAKCIIDDDIIKIINEIDTADIIISVSPSYWADIPGQFKAFIDRCTPWCDTHEPHAFISDGKKGYSVALRTGPGMHECERIIETIEHFYGHLHIESSGHLGLTSIEFKEDLKPKKKEIINFCKDI